MNKRAFTLVELLVSISISIVLMLSIWFLVWNWLWNLKNQEQSVKNYSNFFNFQEKLQEIFYNIDTNFSPILTNSWLIIKLKQNYDEWWFAYIWETIEDKLYCESWSEETKTKHIFIKTFIPNFDIDVQKNHKIDGIWKWFFWYNEVWINWIDLDKIYLNNPTWKQSWLWVDFISDTLNNRILYKSGSKVYELLNENDWLYEPTWLYFDTWEKSLYIANSWKWEILKLSSKKYNLIPALILNWISASSNKFEIKFYSEKWDKNIISPNTTNDFSFLHYSKQAWDSVFINNNEITYSFSGWIIKNFYNEQITIWNLANFSGTWTYYVKFKMWSFEKYYKYFVQADDNILTKDDNSLEVYKSNLDYPTKFNSSQDNVIEYLKQSNSNMTFDKKYDYILKTPIKNLNISYDNTQKLLKLNLSYFINYNCSDLNQKVSKDFLLIKSFK